MSENRRGDFLTHMHCT